jgi:hypothetical protein
MISTPARLLTLVVALVAALALLTAPASAKKVYDYVYSGEYIDGSGSEKGPFPANQPLVDVAFDEGDDSLLVLVGTNGSEGPVTYLSKFKLDGVPFPFNPPVVGDSITFAERLSQQSNLAIDNSGGPNDGRILIGRMVNSGFNRDGTELPPPIPFPSCGLAVDRQGNIWLALFSLMEQYDPDGTPTGKVIDPAFRACQPAVDTTGNIYVVRSPSSVSQGTSVVKFSPAGEELSTVQTGTILGLAVDSSNDDVYVATPSAISQYDSTGVKLNTFGAPDPEHSFAGLDSPYGLTVDPTTHDVWVVNQRNYTGVHRVEKFERTPATITVPTTTTGSVDLAPTAAGLHGTLNADGVETTDCRFEWGTTIELTSSTPCAEGNSFSGSDDNTVSAQLGGLVKGEAYYFRLSAKNANDRLSPGARVKFIAQGKPILADQYVSQVNTDGVQLNGSVDPNGGPTTYRFQWGLDQGYGSSSPEVTLPSRVQPADVSYVVTGLAPDTTYHYRLVAEDEAGQSEAQDRIFRTFAPNPAFDPCPNAQVREQTESSLLADCRAYELVSAANAGGYEVESDLSPGQTPLTAYPWAEDAVLYGLHFGSVPGIEGNPTNFGLDPYVARRGESSWSTSYVGLPANGMTEKSAFGSPLLEADAALAQFAFGGPTICDPCFEDGSINIPLRLADGSLVKGMAGSRTPAADPVGYVGRRFSEDGTHFVFGSTARFENLAKNGELSLYDRDLEAGTTQVISTLPNGTLMNPSGGDLGALDISADGSRIVIGQKVSADAAGNEFWHLYMHVGALTNTIDLTPGTASGALFAGMTADGSRVFFATPDQLLPGVDTDASTDLYAAEVDGGGAVALELLSTAAASPVGDTDACTPAANSAGNNWNAVGMASLDRCDVVPIGGGGGVARDDGTVYFFSPETLDGSGIQGQPNLFLARSGELPELVATLEPDNPAVIDGVADTQVFRFGNFQVTRNGKFAVFNSRLALVDVINFGHSLIYRFDATGDEDAIACMSCAPTGAAPTSDASLTRHGLNLVEDGRVFFTSPEAYVLRDTNQKEDVYEWSNGLLQLISTGSSPDDSTLVTASGDGVDAFYFTRQTLVHGDENGGAVKIYDAREGGGFYHDPPRFPCAASDECHGPGTQSPPQPLISTITGSGKLARLALGCRKGFVKKRGKCVKRKRGNGKARSRRNGR